MKERLKTDRRAESRFVNVGACELLRISRCTFNGYIVPILLMIICGLIETISGSLLSDLILSLLYIEKCKCSIKMDSNYFLFYLIIIAIAYCVF